MKQLVLVGLGGFAGSVLRYLVHLWSINWVANFPSGTMMVNIVGSLIIGILAGLMIKSEQSLYALLVVGFCGGFTTFSTFAMDGLKLMKAEMWGTFFTYAGISIIGGFAAVILGLWLGNKLA
jgi:CrcB protein